MWEKSRLEKSMRSGSFFEMSLAIWRSAKVGFWDRACYDCAKSIDWIIKGDFTGSGMEETLIMWDDSCVFHPENYAPVSLVRQNRIIKNYELFGSWLGTEFIATVKPKTGKAKFLFVAGDIRYGEGYESLDLCKVGKNDIECKSLLHFAQEVQVQHGFKKIEVTDLNNDGVKDLVVLVERVFSINPQEGKIFQKIKNTLVKQGFSFKESEDSSRFVKTYFFEFIFDGQNFKPTERGRKVYQESEEDEKIINNILEAWYKKFLRR